MSATTLGEESPAIPSEAGGPGPDDKPAGSRTGGRLSILFVGRDRRERDEALTRRLAGHLRNRGIEVLWDDPAWRMLETLETLFPRSTDWSPSLRRRVRLAFSILRGLRDPRYLKELASTHGPSLFAREGMLRRRLAALRKGRSIVLLGRSAGAVMSTRIADESGLAGVVCLGYPFRAPGRPFEAVRIEHLRGLGTPTLILQGTSDAYGGRALVSELELSPRIQVRFHPTDHDFEATDLVWEGILREIDDTLDSF